jgi:hypothetical protein
VCASIIEPVAAFGIQGGIQPRVADRHRYLAELPGRRNIEDRFLVAGLHRLHPARIRVAFLDLVPGLVIRVAIIALGLTRDGRDLIASKEAQFFRVE